MSDENTLTITIDDRQPDLRKIVAGLEMIEAGFREIREGVLAALDQSPSGQSAK